MLSISFFSKKQTKKHRNHQAFEALCALGFEPRNIRKAFSKLTDIQHDEVARRLGKSRPIVSNAINASAQVTADDKVKIARIYSVDPEVFFPADEIVPRNDLTPLEEGRFDDTHESQSN